MTKTSELMPHEKRYTGQKQAYEKMFNVICHQGIQIKTMKYHYEHNRMVKCKIRKTPNVGQGIEQQEFSFIIGENAKWYSHFGRQFASFLQS